MAAVLACNSCYQRHFAHINQGRVSDDFSFSGSMSHAKFARFRTIVNDSLATNTFPWIIAAVQQAESDRYGTNGRATKMVSSKDLVNRRDASRQKPSSVNNSKVVVNGASLIKRNNRSALLKAEMKKEPKELPVVDELKVLPSDEGFSWAKDNYNSWQRTIDIWSFVLSLRLRILFDNAKWAYVDGFTEEKQVSNWKHESAHMEIIF